MNYYTPALHAQIYTSRPKVVIYSQSAGILDVSQDVIAVSVTHNLDAVSTASIKLNNYSNALSGRYNFTLHVADKVYISFVLNGTEIPQFVGRIFAVPVVAYDAESFDITVQDCIGDLQYEVWCPYSLEAQKRYFTYNDVNLINAAQAEGISDSGEGNVLYDFLLNVCGMKKNMVYIEKFPDINDVMKNILKELVCKSDLQNQALFEKIFSELFGVNDPNLDSSTGNGSSSGNGSTPQEQQAAEKVWNKWMSAVPIGTGVWQNADQTGEYAEQCWDLFKEYFHVLFNLGYDSSYLYQPNPAIKWDAHGPTHVGGCGGYWQDCKNGKNAFVQKNCTVIEPSSTAQQGDVAFWWETPTTAPGTADSGYGHVAIVIQDQGDKLYVEDQYRGEPKPGGVRYDTYPKNKGDYKLAGYIRPNPVAALNGWGAGSNASQQQALESEAYKLFQYVNFDDANQTILSQELGKYSNLYDNVPCLDFVKSVCSATMRSFISLPDGSFCAFVPDYYGFFQDVTKVENIVDIPDVDLVDYKVNMSKSSYKSHVFLLTNEQFGNVYGWASDNDIETIIRLTESSGIVSFQRDADRLTSFLNIEASGFPQSAKGFTDLMNAWGVSVLKRTDPNIVSHPLTAIEALKMLIDAWANVFTADIKLAFRPDLFPGLRLRIASAGVIVFIKSVTHTWTSTQGGSTRVSSCATCALNGKAGIE